MKKILFICPYPAGLAPSQRFRFEQYLNQLNEKGFYIVVKPFFTDKAYSAFYQSGNLLSKIHAIAKSYFNRCQLLFQVSSFDFIFIHREASPLGPPILEYIIARVLRKKIIFDFDDAIWLTDKTCESTLAKHFRWRSKVGSICKWSYKVSCGNQYLADYSGKFNSNVVINPTTIDTTHLHLPRVPDKISTDKVTIGWTGSHSTLKYLKTIVPVLQSLEKKYPDIEFLVIADEDPQLNLNNYSFRPWNKETEIQDLARMDIGIMPLPNDPWTQGKCGFKALQYMALCIPAVISPIGANREVLDDGIEGYWCITESEWFKHLEELILNPDRIIEMGAKGRQKVMDHYSVESNTSTFLSLFQ